MASKIFPGLFSSLAEISKFIEKHAKAAGLDEDATYAVQLAVDEACANIIEHAYGGEGHGEIKCICNALDDGLEIELYDQGKTFEPKDIKELKIGVPLGELGNRGAGMYLIRKLMDEVHYDFSRESGTRLQMKKRRGG